jgi:hypothetical protein
LFERGDLAAMMPNAALEAALLAVVLVASVALCGTALFWSTTALERWLDNQVASPPTTVVRAPRAAVLDENLHTHAA